MHKTTAWTAWTIENKLVTTTSKVEFQYPMANNTDSADYFDDSCQNLNGDAKTPPSFSSLESRLLTALKSDNGFTPNGIYLHGKVSPNIHEFVRNYLVSPAQQQILLASNYNQIDLLQKIAPFVATALTEYQSIPIRLKVIRFKDKYNSKLITYFLIR